MRIDGKDRRAAALVAACLAVAGCGEPRPPFQAGGREVKAWVADLQDKKPQVRRQAVHKLGNVGDADPLAAEALTQALADPNALVRHDAVLAVVKLAEPGPSIVSALEAMSKGDTDPKVRDVAAKALTRLGGR